MQNQETKGLEKVPLKRQRRNAILQIYPRRETLEQKLIAPPSSPIPIPNTKEGEEEDWYSQNRPRPTSAPPKFQKRYPSYFTFAPYV